MAVVIGAVFFVDAGTCSRAEAPKKSSSIEVVSSKDGDKLNLKFKTIPNKDMVINEDGPWKLEIKKSDGLKFSKTKFERAEVDFKIPGFSATTTAKPSTPSGEVTYKYIAFVCTKDKTLCVRDVHEGTGSWSAK